ncbi:MAG: adenylate/guanylate cyclase domain-containing protein, partial [Alphaproteobacteria bacterium]|nr:adenylate/guanylate cyclase domain-containing protein [Alphaproteobacteria bacterium]
MTDATRRLAAILAADVAGYSRLMGDDEAATVAALNAARGVFKRHIAAQGGRVIDTAGDSVLAVFDSVVQSVGCALAVQSELAEANAARPENRRMAFRIGINLGDVIAQDDGTIYGDGVNIAARLESLANPGGIALSGSAFDQVEGKLDVDFAFLGEKDVKNIARKVRVYQAALGESVAVPQRSETTSPSIAVLPFDNLGGDGDQDYFADGICEDLITELSRLRWLAVTARNSSFTYKGKSVDVTQVGRELGVRYIVEGSVRRGGNRLRITAQLIDAASGNHVWAERYDRDFSDIFALQDEITETLVAALVREVGVVEQDRAHRKPPESLDAWETFQRGMWHCWKMTPDSVHQAEGIL